MLDRRSVSLVPGALGLLALGIVACGSASTEDVESGSAAITHGPPIILPEPGLCLTTSAAVPSGLGISCDTGSPAAYAFSSPSGSCPNISNADGYWSTNIPEVSNVGGTVGGGIAAAWWDLWPTCAQLGLDASCCLYAWNPTVANAAPDTSLLCAPGGDRLVAVPDCSICLSAKGQPVSTGECPNPVPSGGGCPTCRL
jgi:hypothetical protein